MSGPEYVSVKNGVVRRPKETLRYIKNVGSFIWLRHRKIVKTSQSYLLVFVISGFYERCLRVLFINSDVSAFGGNHKIWRLCATRENKRECVENCSQWLVTLPEGSTVIIHYCLW